MNFESGQRQCAQVATAFAHRQDAKNVKNTSKTWRLADFVQHHVDHCNYPQIHYKLGWVYEQKEWVERDIVEYRMHIESGEEEPYVEEARGRVEVLTKGGSP